MKPLRRSRRIALLLGLLLLLQWVGGFGHCLRLAAAHAGQAVEICTVDGLRLLTLAGQEGDTAPKPALQPGCPACQAATAALAPQAPQLSAPVVYAFLLPAMPTAGMPPAPARAPPQQPRAPPIA